MPHDAQLAEHANRSRAEMLIEALRIVCESEGESWQQQEREARLRELASELLGEE